MPSFPQNSNSAVQAMLDLCEMQGVPVWYDKGTFKMRKLRLSAFKYHNPAPILATQNFDTVMRWMEEYKRWNPK